jgi:CRP/FNR family transcriptional regulator, anaerobic regulatory protein
MDTDLYNKIHNQLPLLSDRKLIEKIIEEGTHMILNEGDIMMDYGLTIRSIPIVLDGLVKIMSQGAEGKEIFLYYLSGGRTCPSAFYCCLSSAQSDIKAIVLEDETEIIALPSQIMEDWMVEFPTWKNFVMNSFQVRFKELLSVVDEIAFSKIDERIIRYLSKKAELTESNTLQTTHQQIADDMNSSREVISRLLKKMENLKYIKLSRNMISIIKLPEFQ